MAVLIVHSVKYFVKDGVNCCHWASAVNYMLFCCIGMASTSSGSSESNTIDPNKMSVNNVVFVIFKVLCCFKYCRK